MTYRKDLVSMQLHMQPNRSTRSITKDFGKSWGKITEHKKMRVKEIFALTRVTP